MAKILVSGGGGLLGSALARASADVCSLPRESMDVTVMGDVVDAVDRVSPDVFIHCAAMTRPMALHETQPARGIDTNIIGTGNVAYVCATRHVRLVYISTDYVYPGTSAYYREDADLSPVNAYAWSKLGGECAVRMVPNSLILRCSFAARPFPHDSAFTDSYKSYLYIDEIVGPILKLARGDAIGIINVGGPRRSIFDFARLSRPDVKPIRRDSVGDWVPEDTSMNIHRMQGELCKSL